MLSESALWNDDQYLKPAVMDDPWIMFGNENYFSVSGYYNNMKLFQILNIL